MLFKELRWHKAQKACLAYRIPLYLFTKGLGGKKDLQNRIPLPSEFVSIVYIRCTNPEEQLNGMSKAIEFACVLLAYSQVQMKMDLASFDLFVRRT